MRLRLDRFHFSCNHSLLVISDVKTKIVNRAAIYWVAQYLLGNQIFKLTTFYHTPSYLETLSAKAELGLGIRLGFVVGLGFMARFRVMVGPRMKWKSVVTWKVVHPLVGFHCCRKWNSAIWATKEIEIFAKLWML